MKKRYLLNIFLIVSLLIGGFSLPMAKAQTTTAKEVTLVSSDRQGLELEIRTDPAKLRMGTVDLQSQTLT